MMRDIIYISNPVDAQAARVTAQRVVEIDSHQPYVFKDAVLSKDRLPTIPFTGSNDHNLTGIRCGSLVVIGVFIKQNPKRNKRTSWVVRCDCGYYTIRKSKTIKANHPESACDHCDRIANLERKLL